MRRRFLWVGPPLLAAGIFLLALTGDLPARGGGRDGGPALDHKIRETLVLVIEEGRTLYNGRRDHFGCYRLFQGALVTVRPLLDHHPDLQSAITSGIAEAERIPVPWQQAFALRKVIDDIRVKLASAAPPGADKARLDEGKTDKRPADLGLDGKPRDKMIKKDVGPRDVGIKDRPLKAPDGLPDKVKPADKKPPVKDTEPPVTDKEKLPLDKKVEDKKVEDKAPSDKKKELDNVDPGKPDKGRNVENKRLNDKGKADKKAGDKATADKKEEPNGKAPDAAESVILGRVTYQGKPLPSGFVTLVAKDGRKYSASIREDGLYAFRNIRVPPGEYRVAIDSSVTLARGQQRLAIPQRYQSADTSGLTARINRGENVFDLQLE